MELQFGPPGVTFLGKVGNVYCGCCKKKGLRTRATQIPLGWPKSIRFKREFATCEEHLEETKAAAIAQIAYDRRSDDSEAEYQISRQFGV